MTKEEGRIDADPAPTMRLMSDAADQLPWPASRRAGGGTRTPTVGVLSAVPLPLGYAGGAAVRPHHVSVRAWQLLPSLAIRGRSICRAIAALLTAVALTGALGRAPAAVAQTDASFEFSPRRAAPGSAIDIVARCVGPAGSTGVQLLVVLDRARGSYNHQQTYVPEPDGSVRAAFDIPAEAPPGRYLVYGSCYSNGARFFRHTGAFEVSAPATTTRVTTQVKGKTLSRSDDPVGMLRVLVVLAAIGSVLLVGFGEWSRRHPAGNHHHRRTA